MPKENNEPTMTFIKKRKLRDWKTDRLSLAKIKSNMRELNKKVKPMNARRIDA